MMRKGILAAVAAGVTVTTALAGCSSSKAPATSSSTTNNKVGVLLPDTASSPRWTAADPDEIAKQCTVYKLNCQVYNANGSATEQETQAQQLISSGVGVILLVDLDPASGAQIEAKAKQAGVVVIDYDRYTSGGSAEYYVSYDNVQVGKDQGTALTQCPQVAGKSSVGYVEIDGAPTDNNATLFAQGYNSVLSTQAGWNKLADQTGQWSSTVAQTVFQSMLASNASKIDAVMVANDTMAQSVINVLTGQNLAGKVAVSGQDATPGGLDNIMAGTQCFTIYKAVTGEADVAVKLASQILAGTVKAGTMPSGAVSFTGPDKRTIPAYLATPTVITKANVSQPVTDGYVTAAAVCDNTSLSASALATLIAECNANGISYQPSS
jgi:D-xylose transport system substrate-binding protein